MKAKTTAKRGSSGRISFVQSSYCDVCKLIFNSQQVLANHKLGRKHTKNLQKLVESLNPKPANAPKIVNLTINPSASESKAANDQPKQNAATKENLENKTQKVLHGGAAVDTLRVCTLCNVVCNSEAVYNSHIAGKKHIAKGTNPSASEISTVNDQPKQNAATKEDLETKKQKVLNGGAAADAVRVCTLCNVVCNSDAVYNIHIAGKKHIARTSEHPQVNS
ncbi:zinc finger protein 346-like [Asparagus officinalis]|nr:zinc finger protein 346-like [Asparagus officinalis]